MEPLSQLYQNLLDKHELELNKVKKKIAFMALARIVSFLSAIFVFVIFYSNNLFIGIVGFLLLISTFFYLVKLNVKLNRTRDLLKNLASINRDELLALQHHFSQFGNGAQFINKDHRFTYDLDLFGNGSLFQFLNRTVTPEGAAKFASMLDSPVTEIDKLKKRQELVSELSKDYSWRQLFLASGKITNGEETNLSLFEQWHQSEFTLKSLKFTPLLLFLLPAFSITGIIIWAVGGTTFWIIAAALLQLIFWLTEKNNIKKIFLAFGKQTQQLSTYHSLFKLIERRNWESVEGKLVETELKKNGLPSGEAKLLERIINTSDNRNNFLVGVILNVVFLWDIAFCYLLIKWHNRNRENFIVWGETLSFYEAVCSLSNFAFNHPGFCYPSFSSKRFLFEANNLGHPLINPEKRKNNNFGMDEKEHLSIITGANMAGKSTFLRTVGINLVLSMNGTPVCATEMTFSPVSLYTNMRTSDSLYNDESYFFAELKRLRAILDELEKGNAILVILDEILKGTNSVDKLSGSEKLLEKLITLKAPSIIATHDIKLTEMEKNYPGTIKNLCFEITLANDEMEFDYTLRNGITKTMNATFMMKKMGIIN